MRLFEVRVRFARLRGWMLSVAELTCRMLQGMLADSMTRSCLQTVHETLLVRYTQLALDGLSVF